MASKKVIVCIHGAGPKPDAVKLQGYWRDAMRQGIRRAEPKALEAFEEVEIHQVYWAEHVAHLYEDYDVQLDEQQRVKVLEQLELLEKSKDFRRRRYDALPGKSTLKEFAMDTVAVAGVSRFVWPRVMPEASAYWTENSLWPTKAKKELGDLLLELAASDKDVLLLSHCFGSVIAYDTLWQTRLSNRLTRWITLGSPLSSDYFRRRLLGSTAQGRDRYPANILEWHNIAAEDDYVCHDKSVNNDFGEMLDHRLISDIRDYTIYNLAVRYGRSNPHHSAGYLAHPRTASLLAQWLSQDSLEMQE
ncbi:MAG: hypothetical protein ACI9ON_001866 [Limisphaerales bacterium]|jgi:hypothetical protein